jgi:3-hydroxybutyryl-CoA dehydrogenase
MPEIRQITIIGAGTMGHGIGQEFAGAGFPVVLHDLDSARLREAREQIRRNLLDQVGWGLISADAVQAVLDRIQETTCLAEAAQDVDLVIEAVPEDLGLKRQVLRELDRLCPEHTILGSNTSSFMPSMLASATERPDRVLGVHFFYPPPLMPLVELVQGPYTSDATVGAVLAAVESAGKCPIVIRKEAMGFLVNRLQSALLREALYVVEQGIASAQDVDTAVKESFGRRLAVAGPLEMAEVQDGWDVIAEIQRHILPDLNASAEPSPLIREMVDRGELGPKTGKGFYAWAPESLEEWRRRLAGALACFLRRPGV